MLGVCSICIRFGWQASTKQRDNVGPTAIRCYVVSPSANTGRRPDFDMAFYVDCANSTAWDYLATNQWPVLLTQQAQVAMATSNQRWSDVAITACACWVYSLTRRFWRVPTINVLSRHKKKICPLCRGGCGGRNWLKLFHIHICAQTCCRNDGDARFVSFTLSSSNTGFLKHDKLTTI